jgi:hypothetical protein
MRKITKVGMASILALGMASGVTAAFASTDANQPKPDVKKEQTVVERRHDTTKDLRADRSGKDTYKESWDHSANDGGKDGSKDGPKDGPSKDGSKDTASFDLSKN